MKRNNDKNFIIILLLFIATLSSLTLGYAFRDKILNLNGNVTVMKPGKLVIKSVTLDNSASNTLPSNAGRGLYLSDDGEILIDLNFKVSKEKKEYEATYLITIDNGTPYDYNFTGFGLSPEISIVGASESNAGAFLTYDYVNSANSNLSPQNPIIPARQERTLAVKLSIEVVSENNNTQIGVGGGATVGTSEDTSGSLYGNVISETLNIRNSNIDCFEFELINTYKVDKNFTISSGNSNFVFVNSNGDTTGTFIIASPNESNPDQNQQRYEACVKAKDTAIFNSDTTSTSVLVTTSDQASFNIGTFDVLVNKSEAKDEDPIEIGDVTFSRKIYDVDNTALKASVSWKRLDEGGTDVSKYIILLYDATNSRTNAIKTFEVPGTESTSNYEITLDSAFLNTNGTNMNGTHEYFVRIYGIDGAGNSGLSNCNDSDTTNYCVASSETSLKYRYTVTLKDSSSSTSRIKFSNNSTSTYAYYMAAFSETLNVSSSDYTLDGSVSVTMGTTSLTNNTEYFYGLNSGSNTTGTIRFNSGIINDDITITGRSVYSGQTCLVEGTKIRLADGSVKNIEDVRYDDLLIAFSHDLGKIVYEYPIWVEQKGTIEEYQINTFSDGSVLKTVGTHGVYSLDAKEYVSVMDKEKFHVGTRVAKIDENNNLQVVTVKKIEKINKPVNYYHVSSTYYHNVVAENILTTDAILIVSNMFPFDDNLKWTSEREEFLAKGDVFVWEDWAHVFPEHIFKGFRMREGMILQHKGILDISLFDRILNGRIVEPKKAKSGKYMWMVGNSEEEKGTYYEANTYYTLPEPKEYKGDKEFIGWYNNADNKIYKPGDKVEIIYSMYFVALWEKGC